jgi:outer membrane protein assembly factor BamB
VVHEGYVYSGSHRAGGGLVRIDVRDGDAAIEEVYFSPKLPKAQGGFVLVDGYLYGGGGSTLMCIRFESGDIAWEERLPANSSVCYADGHLYLHAENGEVLLVEATPEAYHEQGRFIPPNPPERGQARAWAYPLIANGRLYIRDRGTLWSFNIQQ